MLPTQGLPRLQVFFDCEAVSAMTRTRRLPVACGIGVLGAVLAFGGATTALGADGASDVAPSLSFPLTTVVYGDPGTVHEVTSSDVPAALTGQECTVSVTADNNESVHPGSDLIVTSGSDEVTVPDVERTAGGTTTAGGPLTLGTTITVAVQLGADGVFSAGGTVDLVCVAPATVTTSSSTTTPAPPPEVVPADVTPDVAPAVAAATVAAPQFTG